jgi:anti-sigma-K factor RskA
MSVRERVVLSAHLLITIECERRRQNSAGLFRAVEREIISRELADLEAEWADNDPTGSLASAKSKRSDWNARVNRRRNRKA